MSPNELLTLARKGWIPAPLETEEAFLLRIESAKQTASHFEPPLEQRELLEEGSTITKKIYGFFIDWVPVVFSNRKLSIFEGAAAWIFQEKKGGPKEAFLQLRKNLKGKKYLYRYYPLKELVAHELVHVARMAYEEPLFEEMLAYETSESSFRKALGPLFRQPKEMNFFLLTLVLPLFGTFLPYLWVIPLLALIGFLARLLFHRRVFERKKQEIRLSSIPETNQGLYLLCLSDEEFFQKGIPLPQGDTPRETLLKTLAKRLECV